MTTLVGLFFTQWSHTAGDTAPRTGLTVEPSVGPGVAALKGTF